MTATKPQQRFIWRPHRRSVTCEWCGKRWGVSDMKDDPAEASIWIDEAGTILCPECFRPRDFGGDDG